MNQPFSSSSPIDGAIAKYLKLREENPEKAEIHANLGSFYAQKQQWQQAIDCYQKAIEIDPTLAGVYRNLAKIFLKIGNQLKAADYLFQGLKLEPFWADAEEHYQLGKLLQSQKKLGRAIASYRQAIELKPDFPDPYYCLGELLLNLEKIEPAIAMYRQAIKQNPRNSRFHFALGQILASQEKWQQASQHYQQALALNSNFALGHYSLGTIFSKINQLSQAQECYQKAILLQPNYWEAYHQLGIVLQEQKQWWQAINAYQKVRELKPQFAPTIVRLAMIYRHLGQYQQAISCYTQVLEIATSDSPLEKEALNGYQTTLERHPQPHPSLYYQLGKILRSKSRFPEAIAAYQKSLELDPNFPWSYIDIQYTEVEEEQLPQLVTFYRQIVSQHPTISLAWGNLGDALTAENKITEAIDCYRTSCYQRTISIYPQLAELNWQKSKKSGPDFIIIGAEKCGTSSLHNYLSYHPQVLLPHKKEINFFRKNFDLGIDWYLSQFPTITDLPDFITGESTPNYLRFPLVAQRIKEHFPQTKLILLLRNPVDRAISWHYHKVNTGLATGDFAQAMEIEIKTIENFTEEDFIKTTYKNPDNIMSSIYLYKIKAWFEFFARDSFLILKSEDLYDNPRHVMSQVFDFLDLPYHELSEYQQINVGSYNAVNPEIRKTLADYFKSYNQELEDYLQVKFDWS
jgi:tetratricopeptide (TPR) repeat protein